ncbi:hypothetical protein COEREDRAFT_79013 [Coemansia reversa NRRL 1564]|uniref:GBD/FH3 domain-containing protein n=1 Tax=Coemansia reversa (strain ATCC 12441 / NRRL 1564) TaxID=763665 RepID=A0A2G5BL45_COERN|nr:hypothetical protein COEREDRAFT_79013 [Coemansia reversa NRRL 1564]|eukprot:PIA19728.1 hypothetical protein COEREDRAFT_79013 [Coemansia reversa NRRL 1564]
MRLPFSLHRSTKSSDSFTQLSDSKGVVTATKTTNVSNFPEVSRDRGVSIGSSSASSMSTSPLRYNNRSRPMSAVFSYSQSPTADMHLAQIEEELDTIMDGMGLQGDRRMAMKNMPVDSKLQLIQSHKAKASRETRTDTTPLSEHLKILARAGTQSLPRARLEKLRVDISYQSIGQITAFVEGGGLRLLLTHLVQLNERRTASRRVDELLKELEILRCVLGVSKVSVGAQAIADGPSNIRRIMDSLGTMWLPCSVMSLRITSYLVQQEDLQCVGAVLSALLRRDSNVSGESHKRRPAFNEWMEAIDGALEEYNSAVVAAADHQSAAEIIDFMSASLTLINSIVDALSPSLDKRIKFYEKLASHDMLSKLSRLRGWHVSILDSHLNRWDESLRRDYNIARSHRSDAVVFDNNGVDSSIRNSSLFKCFVAHYEEAKTVKLKGSLDDASDNDEDYLRMNLATYSDSVPRSTATAVVSAPVTPRGGVRELAVREEAGPSTGLPSTNPFFSSTGSRSTSPAAVAEPTTQSFIPQSSARSSMVAETGCLRTLRLPKDRASESSRNSSSSSSNNSDHSRADHTVLNSAKSPTLWNGGSPAAEPPSENIRSAHELLQKSLPFVPQMSEDIGGAVYKDLQAIVQLAQSLLATFDK